MEERTKWRRREDGRLLRRRWSSGARQEGEEE